MKNIFTGYSKKQKKDFCKDWESSGLTQSQYCRDKGLNAMTFNGWIKKFLKRKARNKNKNENKNKNKFIPLSIDDAVLPKEFLEIKAADRLVIKLPITAEEVSISKIIKELSKCI